MPKGFVIITLGLSLLLGGCFRQPALNQNKNESQNVISVQNNNASISNDRSQVISTTTDQVIVPAAEIAKLVGQIEDWGLYEKISDGKNVIFNFDSCGDNEFDDFVDKVNAGAIYQLKLNGELPLIYTPNYDSWTNSELMGHKSFCQAGAIYPRYAYSDKIFWAGVCSTGYKPDISDPNYAIFQKCLAAEEALNNFLKAKIK